MVVLAGGALVFIECSLSSLGGFSSGSNGAAADAGSNPSEGGGASSGGTEPSTPAPDAGDGGCPTGLVGRWTFDVGTINGSVVADMSGANRSGTLSGNDGPPMSAPGRFGDGLQFQATPSRVTIPNVALDTNANAKNTVSLWFFRAAGGGGGIDEVLFDMPNEPRYDLWLTHAGTTEYLCINTREFDCWGVEASTVGGLRDRWVHVAVVLNNGRTNQTSLYLDGVKRSPTCHTSAGFNDCIHSRTVANPVVLGSGDGSSYPWRGRLDDVRIYSRALGDAEIKSIYDGACQ